MWAFLASALWVLLGYYAVRRIDCAVQRWLDLQVPKADAESAPLEIPEDIVALAHTYSEAWAQEDVLKAARERFEATRDSAIPAHQRWNLVRKALGIGTL